MSVQVTAEYFDVGWRELVAAGGGLEFEVEARLGVNGPASFRPGVPQKYWDGLWGQLRKKGIGMVATDHVDVAFEGRVRVTIDGLRAKPPAPNVVAVVRKTAERAWKKTLSPIGAAHLKEHSIRVGAAREIEITGSERKKYEKAALRAVGSSGMLPTLAEGGAVGLTAGAVDPPELAQLQWTALQPSKLKRLRNRGSLEMQRAPALLRLTNLPGVVKSASGDRRVCAMAQHVVEVSPGDILDPSESAPLAEELAPVQLRRKKRFAFAVAEGLSLDLTQTQSVEGDEYGELPRATRAFEVELERVFGSEATPPTTSDVLAFASLILRHGFCLPRQFGTDVTATIRAQIAAQFAALPSLDDQRAAAAHYSSLKRDAQSRTASWLYHLRCGNNWVKASLIRSALLRIRAETGATACSILDLACGKCADVGKFSRSASDAGMSIKSYVGADIARGSLDDAVERLGNFGGGDFPATLACADLGSAPLRRPLEVWTRESGWSTRPLGEVRADLVSMQFAMHYMFASRERASMFFADVSASMRSGAYFVATTVSAEALVQPLLLQGEAIAAARAGDFPVRAAIRDERGRDVCVVTYDAATVRALFSGEDDESKFGLRYTFELHDDESGAAVAAPEWMVLQEHLRELASEHDMELAHYEPLPAFFRANAADPQQRELLGRMHVPNMSGSISRAEWDIMSLYCVAVFKKRAPRPAPSFMQVYKQLKASHPGFAELSSSEKKALVASKMSRKRKRA